MPTENRQPLRTRLLAPAGPIRDAPRHVIDSLPPATRDRVNAGMFKVRWGFDAPPAWADWSRYERFLALAESHRTRRGPRRRRRDRRAARRRHLQALPLVRAQRPGKRVIAVDVFDPTFDITTCSDGERMADLYQEALAGREQRSVFDTVTASCTNLTVIAGDSAAVELPCEAISFAYVDGNHSAAYVRSDFELVWDRLSPGGVVGFDDYGADIAEVTHTLHEMIGEHASEIARVWVDWRTLLIERA